MSSIPVKPTPSDDRNGVVPKECGDRDEVRNERVKRSKHNHPESFVEQSHVHIKRTLEIYSVLHRWTSQYQDIVVVDTKAFGKAFVINGKLQNAEVDEFIYHESLVHHALLLHENPKKVFIMGGGDGSAAREVLKHHKVEKVVVCDIDKDVVEFCKKHMTKNIAAFSDARLHIVINDAKVELESSDEKFDVIIGDLSDPIKGGPCNSLYIKSFYEEVIKAKLNNHGIFVTQAGLAGVLSHKDIFSPIYNTIKQVFSHVIAYTAPIPSYADSCGWVLATDGLIELNFEKMLRRIKARISGEMYYLDAAFIVSAHILNKTVYNTLLKETRVITDENLMFTHGHGIAEHVDGGDVRVLSAFVKPFMEDRAPTLEAFMEDVRYTPDGVVPNE